MNGEVEKIKDSTHNEMTHARAMWNECEPELLSAREPSSVRASGQGKQSRDADTNSKEERPPKTNKLSCGSIHSVHESLDVFVGFYMLQVIAHVVVLVVLCAESTCRHCTRFIHFLTCTGIPCRDLHCEM